MVFQKLLLSACTSQLPDRGGLAVGINTTQANISTCHLATRVSLCLANFQLWGYRCDRLFRKRALEGPHRDRRALLLGPCRACPETSR